MTSKLIKAAAAVAVEPVISLADEPKLQHIKAPEPRYAIPLDVQKARREAEKDPSDPFLARRLAGHYRQGIWSPS